MDKLRDHLKMCQLLRIPCPLGCPQEGGDGVMRVERGQMETHKLEVCLMRSLSCEFCEERVKACEMNAHLVTCEEFVIYCPNKCEGNTEVPWLKRKEIDYHLKEVCLFEKVCCHLCADEMERRLLKEHQTDSCPLRQIKCELCDLEFQYCDKSTHLDVCDDFLIYCPNNCLDGLTFQRRNLSQHLASCPLQEVKCPYFEYGCEFKMERKVLEAHEKDLTHIHMKLMNSHFQLMNSCLQHSIVELKKENEQLRTIPNRGGIEWSIPDFDKILANVFSDPFYVGLYKMQASFQYSYHKHCFRCYIHIISGKWDNELTWPLLFSCDVIFLTTNKREDNLNFSNLVTQEDVLHSPTCFRKPNKSRNAGFSCTNFIPPNFLNEGGFIDDNSLKLEIIVTVTPTNSQISTLTQSDIPALRNSIISIYEKLSYLQQGQIQWKIESISERIKEKQHVKSPSFYASFYKFRCNMFFNPKNTGYISCYVDILKGDRDDSLKWPISGKLTLTLSNHDTPEHNHTLVTEIPDGFFENPSTTKNDSYGFPKFLHLEQMLNPKYCRNNYITLDVKYEL